MLDVLGRDLDQRSRANISMQSSQAVAEMTQLATLTAINTLLQKENEDLQKQLEDLRSQPDQADVEDLRREFATRLGQYEKQITLLKDKNEALKAQVQAVSQGGSVSQARLQDRERSLRDLQAEAEALSRKNGELESTVRKLRGDLRGLEGEREWERNRVKALEAEAASAQARAAAQMQALENDCAALEAELEAVRLEAQEQVKTARREAAEAISGAESQLEAGRSSSLATARLREEELQSQLASLHATYEAAEEGWGQREAALRREITQLEERILQLEDLNANLTASASSSAQPLLRQIESLSLSAAAAERKHADLQQRLQARVNEAEASANAALQSENQLKTRVAAAEAGLAAAKERAAALAGDLEQQRAQLAEERRRAAALLAERDSARELQASVERRAEEAASVSREQLEILVEKLYATEEKVRDLHAQALEAPKQSTAGLGRFPTPPGSSGAPAAEADSFKLSAGPGGLEEEADDLDQLIRAVEEGGQRAGAASARTSRLEHRVRIAEQNTARAQEEARISLARAKALEEEAYRSRQLEASLQEMQERFDMALELLGERNEVVESLEMDVQEMRDIFHSQLQEAVDQLNALRATVEGSGGASTSAGPKLTERMGRG